MIKIPNKLSHDAIFEQFRRIVMFLFALAFSLILTFAFTPSTVSAISNPTTTEPIDTLEQDNQSAQKVPDDVIEKSNELIEKVKNILSNVLHPEKLPNLALAIAIVFIVVGLAKKLLSLCVVAVMMVAIVYLSQSPVLDDAVAYIVDWINKAIAPLGNGDYINDAATTATPVIQSGYEFVRNTVC